jgi:hypothetical protein
MPKIDLPEEPIRPGGEFFKPDSDWWHNAVVDPYRPSWYIYAAGYLRAAESLIGQVSTRRSEIDFLVYPIIFLYRQYLELSLKYISADAEALARAYKEPLRTHRLDLLWSRGRAAIEAALPGTDLTDLAVVDNCIVQFAALDPSSETFRYPVRKDGAPVHLPVTHINLRNLSEEMANVARVIESFSNYILVQLDLQRDMDAYYAP